VNQENKTIAPEDGLRSLEDRIDALVQVCKRLHSENHQLKEQKSGLMQERASLMAKTEKARSRVEAMISRLKGMEY